MDSHPLLNDISLTIALMSVPYRTATYAIEHELALHGNVLYIFTIPNPLQYEYLS